jgi:hypothetical protein
MPRRRRERDSSQGLPLSEIQVGKRVRESVCGGDVVQKIRSNLEHKADIKEARTPFLFRKRCLRSPTTKSISLAIINYFTHIQHCQDAAIRRVKGTIGFSCGDMSRR